MRKSVRLEIRKRRGHGNGLRRWSGETSGRKEREGGRKNPPVNPARWGARQDNLPFSSVRTLRKTLAAQCNVTQDLLRSHDRSLQWRYTRRQVRRQALYPQARSIHRPFIVPGHAIVIFRGNGHVFGTKSWQPGRKKNIQGSKKQIHLALRFLYAWAGIGNGGTNRLSLQSES